MSLRIVLASGSPLPDVFDLLEAAGLPLADVRRAPAHTLHRLSDGSCVLVAPPSDVATFVERGGADLGVVGKETLVEVDPDVYELLDLREGRGRLVFALPVGMPDVWALEEGYSRVTIATKYPETTRRYFEESGRQVEVVPLQGPVERAPGLHLADAVVDLVRSGRTLRDAGLEEREVIDHYSQRLIACRSAHALRAREIGALTERLRELRDRGRRGAGARDGAAAGAAR